MIQYTKVIKYTCFTIQDVKEMGLDEFIQRVKDLPKLLSNDRELVLEARTEQRYPDYLIVTNQNGGSWFQDSDGNEFDYFIIQEEE